MPKKAAPSTLMYHKSMIIRRQTKEFLRYLPDISSLLFKSEIPISRGFDTQDNVLVVITKALAENVDAARMLGVVLDADAHADRMMALEIELAEIDRRDPEAVDIGAVGGNAPVLELAVMRALELPPCR